MTIFTKRKIKDFIIYGFGQLINIVSPLFVMPFILFKCGEVGLGKVGVGFSCALILSGIIDYGSYIKGVKDISINRKNLIVLEKKFKSIYLSKLILLVGVFCFFSLCVLFVPFFSRDKSLYFFSSLIVLGQFINPQWFFQGIENFKWISIVNTVSKSIYILLILLFIEKKTDYVYANLFFGIGAIIGNSIGILWILRKYSFDFKKFDFNDAIFILKDEFSFSISQIFLSIYQFFPIILISYFGGDFMAGQFRVIDQIISLFKTYLNMFFYFVYSNICFELSKSKETGIKVWKQYNGLNFIIIFLTLLFFFAFSQDIMLLMNINKDKIFALSSIFKVALFVPFLISISQPLRQLMFAFSENKIYIQITIITTSLNVVFLSIFTKYYELFGAFLSIIFVELAVIILYISILKKHFLNH